MMEIIATTNYVLALLGIGVFLSATVLVVDFYTSKTFEHLVYTWGLWVAFLITFSSSTLTLIYSEVFGFIPCGLCWLQRAFLFPQVFLLGMALYYRDKMIARYGILLSSLGLSVSLYQHYLQMGGSEFIKCPAAGVGADCVKRYFFEFGFMTFPLMSAAAFVFLIVLYVYLLKARTH